MPFDSESAAAAGKKGGAKKRKDPSEVRSHGLYLALTAGEKEMVGDKAAALGVSRAQLVVLAVREYRVF